MMSVCSSFMLADTFVNPLPVSSRSIENGGTLSAIDAYQDGVGAMVVEKGRGIDNSAMNALVFKYGSEAKLNTLSIGDQVLLSGTNNDKSLANIFFINGNPCDDKNALTSNETWLNGICQGGLFTSGNGLSTGIPSYSPTIINWTSSINISLVNYFYIWKGPNLFGTYGTNYWSVRCVK